MKQQGIHTVLLLRFFEYPIIKLHPPKQLNSTEVCHSWVNKLQWVVLREQKNNLFHVLLESLPALAKLALEDEMLRTATATAPRDP